MSFELPKSSIGFLFKIIDPKNNETKGYLYGADHSADQEMLTALRNDKMQKIFNRSTEFYFENFARNINDIDELSENKGIENYTANLITLDANPESFSKLVGIPPPDIELQKTLPGVDYHLLSKIYEEREEKHLHSLEATDADQQQNASKETVGKFHDNLATFLENATNSHELLVAAKEEAFEEDFDVIEIVRQKNEAWKSGDLEKFVETMKKLDRNFFSKVRDTDDPEGHTIAFGRNRDVDLARAVHNKLIQSDKKPFFIFGTSHLVSSDPINLRSILEAKGWIIKQIK